MRERHGYFEKKLSRVCIKFVKKKRHLAEMPQVNDFIFGP